MSAFGHRDEHDVHHPDTAHHQTDRTDDPSQNHEGTRELVPQIAQKIWGTNLEVVLFIGRYVAQASHRLDNLVLCGLHFDALRHRKRQDEFLGFGIVLSEAAERNHGESIDSGTDEQSRVMLEY